MSYLATQNLNPTYNTITATTITATNISGVNVTPTTLTLKDPIVSSNISQPDITELGYFTNTSNSAEVELTTATNTELVVTSALNPVGVYQVNARVQLTIEAGTTITSYTLFIETTAGIILEKVESNPVTYADACSYSFSMLFQSNCATISNFYYCRF